MIKFQKNITGGPVTIPAAALKLCGLEAGGKAELHALEGAAVLMKAPMNAMELIRALDSLHQLTVALTVHLAKVCGSCDGCGGECPFGDFSYEEITLPDNLREEAGIPAGVKLCAYADDEENTITICEAGYDHDLRDVPEYLLEMLESAGICMGELEERLMVGDTVYGA